MSKIPQEAIEALDWANFDEIKLNREWLPNDQDLIYTAINAYNGEGDMDDDCLEQIIERLLLAWRRADAAREQGWLYDNEDTGREFSENHPIESGEVPDATNIVPANAENLKAELLSTWKLQAEIVQDRDSLREEVYAIARAQGAEVEPYRWIVEERLPGGSIRWQCVEHENHAKSLAAESKCAATVEPLFKRPPAPQPTDREKVLEDALKNMMGIYDTPLSRRRFPPDEFMQEVLKKARAALAGGEA